MEYASNEVRRRNAHLLHTGAFADCRFRVWKKRVEFKAHRLILAGASPVFGRMFYGKALKNQQAFYELDDVTPMTFKAILDYIYVGSTELGAPEAVQRIQRCALDFELLELANRCSHYLVRTITPDNAASLFEHAQDIADDALAAECLRFIRHYTVEVLEADSFQRLQVATLAALLSQNELNCHEADLLRAAAVYAQHNGLCRQNFKPADSLDQGRRIENIGHVELKKPALYKKVMDTVLDTIHKKEAAWDSVVKQLRLLTLTEQEYLACCPELGVLLTADEISDVYMNVAGLGQQVRMPAGFSQSRRLRCGRTRTRRRSRQDSFRLTVARRLLNTEVATSPWHPMGGCLWRITSTMCRVEGRKYLGVNVECGGPVTKERTKLKDRGSEHEERVQVEALTDHDVELKDIAKIASLSHNSGDGEKKSRKRDSESEDFKCKRRKYEQTEIEREQWSDFIKGERPEDWSEGKHQRNNGESEMEWENDSGNFESDQKYTSDLAVDSWSCRVSGSVRLVKKDGSLDEMRIYTWSKAKFDQSSPVKNFQRFMLWSDVCHHGNGFFDAQDRLTIRLSLKVDTVSH